MERKRRMFPVQIWTPLFSISPFNDAFNRDLQRAAEEYRGEMHIWLSPSAKEVTGWRKRHGPYFIDEFMMPSEILNEITVYHVDESGRIYPPLPLPKEWQKRLPEALYTKWLSTNAELILGKKSITIDWPKIKDDEVTYESKEVKLEPLTLLPIVSVNKKKRRMRFRFPPPGSLPHPSVSPEADSRHVHGKLKWDKLNIGGREIDIVVSKKDPKHRGINQWIRWPEPFHLMLPPGSFDIFHHYALMKSCLNDLNDGKDYQQVLQVAESWVNRLTEEVTTTIEAGWFMPKLVDNPSTAIFEVEIRFNIATQTMDVNKSMVELEKSEHFWEEMNSSMKVRRTQSWLGYFWWEFYQDLKANVTIRLCQRCGNIIRGGHADRQFCRQEENPECFRKQNAERQRKSRKRRSSQQNNK